MGTCHPFLDSQGKPADTVLAGAGSADLDGDRHQDLWFLAAAGKDRGRISVQMARASSLGRFRSWHLSTAGNFLDAATYRSTAHSRDGLLLVDPTSNQPILLTWSRKSPLGDPRDGFLGGGGSGWPLGLAAYEIEVRDDVGDGHDDITVLQRLPNGHTRVKKLCMNTKLYAFLWPERSVAVDVPARLETLRMLDFDGDGRSDFVALARGLGVLVGRDNGHGSFDAAAFWPIPSGINDVTVGDVQGDGRDDFLLCFDGGVLVMLSTPQGFWPRAMFNAPRVGALACANLVDVDGTGKAHLAGFPEDGRNYVFHDSASILANRYSPLAYPAHTYWSSKSFPGVRPGTADNNVIVTDVDNDGDVDLLLRTPDRTGFMTLRNPSVALRPTDLKVTNAGPLPAREVSQGVVQDLVVTVPPLLRRRGFTSIEAAFFVVDPDTRSLNDPDYLYWGRIIVPIQPTQSNARVRIYVWGDQQRWDNSVRAYKKQRAANLGTNTIVYPPEFGTIRFSADGFVSVHGYNGGERAESAHVEDPSKGKSTLGPRWVLKVNPPKPKADRDLLPWD
ncbi:MAG: FG-GAP repeat domain-containing protein [Planctomycetota bacterium]